MRSDRREMMTGSVLLLTGLASSSTVAQDDIVPALEGTATKHDFDYFVGSWRVEHRRLRKRLAASSDWEEFRGQTQCQQMFGGLVNLNESISYRGGRTSYGMGLRAFDAPGGRWVDWYLAASDLSKIDPPLYGRFNDGVGTFYAKDVFEGRPILVRGRFASVSDTEARWEQAFSTDDGRSWETNWIMRYLRSS